MFLCLLKQWPQRFGDISQVQAVCLRKPLAITTQLFGLEMQVRLECLLAVAFAFDRRRTDAWRVAPETDVREALVRIGNVISPAAT